MTMRVWAGSALSWPGFVIAATLGLGALMVRASYIEAHHVVPAASTLIIATLNAKFVPFIVVPGIAVSAAAWAPRYASGEFRTRLTSLTSLTLKILGDGLRRVCAPGILPALVLIAVASASWKGVTAIDTPTSAAGNRAQDLVTVMPWLVVGLTVIQLLVALVAIHLIIALSRVWHDVPWAPGIAVAITLSWLAASSIDFGSANTWWQAGPNLQFVVAIVTFGPFPGHLGAATTAILVIVASSGIADLRNNTGSSWWHAPAVVPLLIVLSVGIRLFGTTAHNRGTAGVAYLLGSGTGGIIPYFAALFSYFIVPFAIGMRTFAAAHAQFPAAVLRYARHADYWWAGITRLGFFALAYTLLLGCTAAGMQFIDDGGRSLSRAAPALLWATVIMLLAVTAVCLCAWVLLLLRGRRADALVAVPAIVIVFMPGVAGGRLASAVPMLSGQLRHPAVGTVVLAALCGVLTIFVVRLAERNLASLTGDLT